VIPGRDWGSSYAFCLLYLRLQRSFGLQSFGDGDGAAIAGFDAAAADLIAVELQGEDVSTGRDLDARGRELAGGFTIHQDFRTGGSGVYLYPGDAV